MAALIIVIFLALCNNGLELTPLNITSWDNFFVFSLFDVSIGEPGQDGFWNGAAFMVCFDSGEWKFDFFYMNGKTGRQEYLDYIGSNYE